MVQATRWRVDARLQATNPYQRVRFATSFPSGGQGDSAFGWSPVPIDGAIHPVGSPNGFSTASGLSGGLGRLWARRAGRWHTHSGVAGLGLSLDISGLLRGAFAIGGIAAGLWLAKKNLEG